MIDCPPGWVEIVREADPTDGPVLAYINDRDKSLVYLRRWWYAFFFDYMKPFLQMHERTHAWLYPDTDDCPNEECIMYGGHTDSWQEKNPLVWLKVLKHFFDTGCWWCDSHRDRLKSLGAID